MIDEYVIFMENEYETKTFIQELVTVKDLKKNIQNINI